MPEDPVRRYARMHEWRAANRQKLNEQERVRRARDPERYREQQRARRARNRERVREQNQRGRAWSTHGMRPGDWAAMWDAQAGRCYLCGEQLSEGKVDVDHDHSCCGPKRSCRICRRGLACRRCNSVAGYASDDPDLLQQIADNLRVAKRVVAARMAERGEQPTLMD